MKKMLKPSFLISGFALGLGLYQAQSADMESVYNKYLQGDYIHAQSELEEIIQANPSTEELFKMKEALGMRAVLELSQNQYLQDSMKIFNSGSWQHERAQFKNPRHFCILILLMFPFHRFYPWFHIAYRKTRTCAHCHYDTVHPAHCVHRTRHRTTRGPLIQVWCAVEALSTSLSV